MDGATWGWLHSCRVQIVRFIADEPTAHLFAKHFKDLPGKLIEAACFEGASCLRIHRRIVMPLSGPIPATAAILKVLCCTAGIAGRRW